MWLELAKSCLSHVQHLERLHRQNVVYFGGEGETFNLGKYLRTGFLELLS